MFKLWQSINEINKELSQYLQLCRSKTDYQCGIHFLLEAICLTVNSTKPSPVTAHLLQVKSESIIIFNAQNSFFYTDYLATKCLVSFIGHKVTCFFYWPQSDLFLLLATKWLVSFIGRKVANAFALSLPHSLFLAIKWPMLLVLTLHARIHCKMTILHVFLWHNRFWLFAIEVFLSPFYFNNFCQFVIRFA